MMIDYENNIFFYLLLFFSFLWQETSGGKGNWSYFGSGGTKGWKSTYHVCNGKQQSPIDIITPRAEGKDYGPIEILNYDTASAQVLLKNNGATVTADFQLDPKATINGGGLKVEYIGHSFHFHWGSTDDFGSEHYKDGTTFPMEMHIVHYSSKYRDIHEAMDQPEGLAVLGFFFIITTANNSILQSIIEKFPHIQTVGMQVNVNAHLGMLIPKDRDKYYRYSGSLTTPPCYESVIWTIFDSTIAVSSLQMKEFRTRLEMKSSGPTRKLLDNYRHIQPLYQREIHVNKADPIQLEALIVAIMIGVHFLWNADNFMMMLKVLKKL